MKRRFPIVAALLLFVLATACAGRSEPVAPEPQIGGPALVMFYTDN